MDTDYPLAKPSIEAVVHEFLADATAARQKTDQDKKGALELFMECINSYGHQFLTPDELEVLDFHENQAAGKRLNFCQIFGTDKVPQNAPLFLGYYLIAKAMFDASEMEAGGCVVTEFCKWLGERKYLPTDQARQIEQRTRELTSVLGKAEIVNKMIWRLGERCPSGRERYLETAHRVISRIQGDALWLVGKDGEEIGPVGLPEGAAGLLELDWTICSALAKKGEKWHFSEVGNVYPDPNRGEYVLGENR